MSDRGTGESDNPDDRDDQEPEYQLVDHGDGGGTGEPEYELVDHEPPPPDDKVIEQLEARAHISERSWLLGTLIVVTVVVILSDIALSLDPPMNCDRSFPARSPNAGFRQVSPGMMAWPRAPAAACG